VSHREQWSVRGHASHRYVYRARRSPSRHGGDDLRIGPTLDCGCRSVEIDGAVALCRSEPRARDCDEEQTSRNATNNKSFARDVLLHVMFKSASSTHNSTVNPSRERSNRVTVDN